MKKLICILAGAALFGACEQKETVVSPAASSPGEKKVERNTTVVNPPASTEKKETTNTIVNPAATTEKKETTTTASSPSP